MGPRPPRSGAQKGRGILGVLVALALVAALPACASLAPDRRIRLTDLQPLATPDDPDPRPLRVAIAAVISPQGTAENYQPLLEYIGQKLNRPVQLVQRRTYAEVNALIEAGEVDLAFVCTSAYVAGHDSFGMRLLAVPQVHGETVYHSLLIVPAESAATNMADLEGKVFAFTDPMSTTGRAYPTQLVQQLGSTPESFFARTFFTYSHDDAIRAVGSGLADGAAVDSLVYEFAMARDPSLARSTRVIHVSPPLGMPPVVVGPGVRAQTAAELQALLLAMALDDSGRTVLEALDIQGFVLGSDDDYDGVRRLLADTGPLSP